MQKSPSARLLLTLTVLAGCAEASPDDSIAFEQAVVQTSVTYTLVGVQSGRCVEVSSNDNRAAAVIRGCTTGNARQQFRFEDVGSGFYRMRAVASNRCLDVEDAGTATGARIIQWDCGTGMNQQFSAADRGNTVHQLVARHSNQALDVSGRGTADGTPIIQWTLSASAQNQQFRLTPVSGGGAGGTPPPPPSNGSDPFPCNGTTSGYEATVINAGGTWTARNGSRTVYTGSDTRAAIQAGLDSLSAGRTSKQRVLVQGSGSIAANSRLNIGSYTVLNVCGTLNVTGSGSSDMAPIYARGRRDIEIPHVTITGTPAYAMFFRDVENITLGQVDIRVSSGLGIRVDNHGRSDRSQKVRNLRIGSAFVQGTGAHAVETYGVDGVTIGTVTARDVGESGLLFNDTVNATVGTVDAQNAGAGTGYAAFRMANRNGRIGNAYPTNIRVGTVIARGGGRGIFCVSESGGAVIDRVDIAQTGNNSILIENCYNVTVSAGSVNGAEIRIASRSTFPVSSNVTIQNLTLTNSAITESPCGTNNVVRNISLVNSRINVCSGTAR